MKDDEKEYKYTVGDTVQLMSGGPIMTITKQNFGGDYWCVWFDGDTRQESRFSQATLKPADSSKS
jgi:uncharacterized protein YodC (DUF2158 family)